MIVIGGVLLVAAGVLLLLARRNAASARRLTCTENLRPAQLVRLHEEATPDGEPGGGFLRTADTSGVARCDVPLHSPLSTTPCVHFRATVTACIEELRTSTDADGRQSQRWERADRVVSDHEVGTTFELHDAGAGVSVAADGAEIDEPVVAVDRFERAEGAKLSIGALEVAGMSLGGGGGQRVLGYRHVERVVPVGARVFVHGSADDSAGRLTFRVADGRPLMISTRSEEEIVASGLRSAAWQRLAAAGCAAGATALTVAALVPG